MNNKLSLYINNGWVIVNNNGKEIYQDILSNFQKDYGKKMSFKSCEYNLDTGVCVIDGVQKEGKHNLECDDILENLYDIMAKQYRRGYIIPQTTDDVKKGKLNELKAERDTAEQQPVQTNKGVFDVDDKSLQRINGAIAVLSISHGAINWTLADNTVAEVNEEDLRNVIVVLAMQSNTVHEKYRLLKEQVNACETVEQVEAISWNGTL